MHLLPRAASALSRVRQNFSRTAASLTPCRPFPTVAASPFSGIWIRPRGRSKTSPGTARFPFPYNCVCKAAACAHIPQGKSIGSLRKSYFAPARVSENTSLSPEPLLLFDLTIQGEKDYTVFLENERSIIRLFACPREGYLYIDLTRAEEFYEHTVGKIPLGKRGKMRVVKDGCALDVFADGGKNWYSAFVFSENMRYFVRLASEGALHAKNVRLKTGRV